ncbi:MAG: hypothetical protein F6K23_25505 [Okeania sp. SIO2C9]|uniref:hypothetical protein n=1 Tax=Okeania sp. SIO2C9 TaxID=2607791 RepID=UPI0013C1E5F0|nr:hypothetical protein [Okeania sp. SIO2C9]NEQ76098.1 hypothetical protein [Okeania sp. SIO2C9]
MTREIAQAVAAEFQVKPLLQNDALKTHLTNSKCPKKLVLATHGFFLEQDYPPPTFLRKGRVYWIGFSFTSNKS